MTWGSCGYPYQGNSIFKESEKQVGLNFITDLSEHELYEAVKHHDVRPPISQLTNLYPRNLLVLIMEMWETDPLLVRNNRSFHNVFILYFKKRPSMNHVVERLSAYLT